MKRVFCGYDTIVMQRLISYPNAKSEDIFHDFEICVGDKVYKCNKLLACLFSPYIMELVKCDPTASNFIIDIKEGYEDKDNSFESIIDFMYLQAIDVERVNLKLLEHYSCQLGRFDFIEMIDEELNYERDDFSKCMCVLRLKKSMNQYYSEEIEHLATNFYRIDSSVFELLDLETIDEIISSPSLVCDDEHSLFEFVVKLVQDRGSEYQTLFTNIVFPNLPPDDIETFLAIFDITFMNSFILRSLARSRSINIPENRYRIGIDTKNPVDVFHHLIKVAGRNPATAGLVSITVSSIKGDLYEGYSSDNPEVVLDFESDKGWYTVNSHGQWIMFDFKDKKVKASHYEIKFGMGTNGYSQNWIFEASNDQTTWFTLHQNSSTNYPFTTHKYEVDKEGYYRYYRVKQVNKCWGARYYQGFTNFEIYGIISK